MLAFMFFLVGLWLWFPVSIPIPILTHRSHLDSDSTPLLCSALLCSSDSHNAARAAPPDNSSHATMRRDGNRSDDVISGDGDGDDDDD